MYRVHWSALLLCSVYAGIALATIDLPCVMTVFLQTYLTHWANKLDAPIISVDYSLAPEDPYPRAVNDCLYAYAWALKNSKQLGSTARRIIFVGDSAGGNFVFSVALLASQYRIPVPNLLLAAYPALFIELNPSPGRLQSVLDPLLPYGVLNACLLAYRGPDR